MAACTEPRDLQVLGYSQSRDLQVLGDDWEYWSLSQLVCSKHPSGSGGKVK